MPEVRDRDKCRFQRRGRDRGEPGIPGEQLSVEVIILLFTRACPSIIMKEKQTCSQEKGGETMTRLELLTVLLSIKALLESDNRDKALELINEVIAEAKTKSE